MDIQESALTTNLFKSKEQVLDLIFRADENFETKRLISKHRNLQQTRTPYYLTLNDFDEILHWKLRQQYGRQNKFRDRNSDYNVQVVTKAAFMVEHQDKDYETELRLKLLITLSGVEVPVASAILTICYPEKYSVIDYRNWRQIYGNDNEKTFYTTKEYCKYLAVIRRMANSFGLTLQEIDLAIWQYDREVNL